MTTQTIENQKVNITTTLVLRFFLATILLIFGFNKFFMFLPMFEMPEAAGALMGAIFKSGYLMQTVGLVEIITGAGLLLKRTTPLALVLLGPISVNIVLFHLFLDVANIFPALLVAGLNTVLIYKFRANYKSIWQD